MNQRTKMVEKNGKINAWLKENKGQLTGQQQPVQSEALSS